MGFNNTVTITPINVTTSDYNSINNILDTAKDIAALGVALNNFDGAIAVEIVDKNKDERKWIPIATQAVFDFSKQLAAKINGKTFDDKVIIFVVSMIVALNPTDFTKVAPKADGN